MVGVESGVCVAPAFGMTVSFMLVCGIGGLVSGDLFSGLVLSALVVALDDELSRAGVVVWAKAVDEINRSAATNRTMISSQSIDVIAC